METHEAEWLSLIKYQMTVAEEQAKQPSPLNSLAISTLHDAVESMLNLVAQATRAEVKGNRPDFLQIFDAIDKTLDPTGIAGDRAAMAAMNTTRVAFKHHGSRPDERTLQRHLARASEFVTGLCQTVFDTSFDDVPLLLFVTQSGVRQELEAADRCRAAGDWVVAMQHLWKAFDALVESCESSKTSVESPIVV